MRLTHGIRMMGILLLLILLGGTQATASDVGRATAGLAFLLRQQEAVCIQAVGTPEGATPDDKTAGVGGTPITAEESGTPVRSVGEGQVSTPIIETETDPVVTPVIGDEASTPVSEASDAMGDDVTLDVSVEGFLCQDVDGDGTYEIGIDQDADGTLDVNEVLGTDLDNNETLTEDEFDPGAAGPADVGAAGAFGEDEDETTTEDEFDPGAAGPADVGAAGAFGEDEALDANDEGYLRQDVDQDGIFEIGIDEDENGTLGEAEIWGRDLNNDEVLTEDELDR